MFAKRPINRRWLTTWLRWFVAPSFVFGGVLVLGFRLRWRPVVDAVRTFNKWVLNPAMLRLAGRRHWYAAAVRHVGRRSGRPYETPVVVVPTPGGFLIPLPYGTDVDWLRNIRAAGRCVIESRGVTYTVGEPELIDVSVALPLLPLRQQRSFRLFGVEHFLRVTLLAGLPAGQEATAGARST
jgi:deazaflavin-dependent oxidoreductase (nitroreductase family)